MDKEALKKMVTVNLRCATQSSKGGVNINSLQSDYKGLIGSTIPFIELGHTSLKSFLQSIPDVVCLKMYKGGLCMVEGVADSSTAHIANLISRQKNTKSTKGNSKKPSMPIRKYHESWRSTSNNPEKMGKASISNSPNVKVPLSKLKNTGVSTAIKLTTSQNNMISQHSNVTKSNPSLPVLNSQNTGVSSSTANQSNVKSKQSNITKTNPSVSVLKSKSTGVKPVQITKVNPLAEGTSNSVKTYCSLPTDIYTLKGSTIPSSILPTKVNNQQNSTISHSLKIASVSQELSTNLNNVDSTLSNTKIKINELTERLEKASEVPLTKTQRKSIRKKLRNAEKLLCETEIVMKKLKGKCVPPNLLNENQFQDFCNIFAVSPSIQKEQLKKFTIINLQNVILSSKGGVPLINLQRDYENLFGIPIPYKELNYNSLEAFIQDIPDVINLKINKNGQNYVQTVSDETAADISSKFFNQCAVETIPPPVAPNTVLPSFHQREPSYSKFQNTTVTNAVYKPSLKCFPKIKYSIESAKFSSLLMMNLLLFGDDSYMEILKRGILSFDGFDFCEGSDKWKEREILFSMLSKDSLRECLKLLCIDCRSDNKQELVNKLLQFLAFPCDAYSKRKR